MTILIADDNTLIRSWLKIMLTQLEGEDLRLLEAADGNEALNLCLKEDVDLLIVDIQMPVMNGISVIRALQEQKPSVQSAVLSSYDDFSYVHDALQCGALDYILKAEMQQDDLVSLLKKTRDRLRLLENSSLRLSRYLPSIENAARAYEKLQQSGDRAAPEFLAACGLSEKYQMFALTLMHIERNPAHPADADIAPLCCHVLSQAGLEGITIPIEDSLYLLLFGVPADMSASQDETHMRLLSSLQQSLEATAAGTLAKNASITFSVTESLPKKISYLKDLLDYQYYYDSRDVPEQTPSHREGEQRFRERFQYLVSLNDTAGACILLKKYVQESHAVKEVPHRIRRTVMSACHIMFAAVPESRQQTEDVHYMENLIQDVLKACTAVYMERKVGQLCGVFTDLCKESRHYSGPVRQAIDYCNQHYAEKISLDKVADHTKLNRSYFSYLFHKETGMPFHDYLEDIRIRNSCRLLKNTSLPMSDVAEQTGFANQNYFTKVFKNVMGVTPSQYRKAQQ